MTRPALVTLIPLVTLLNATNATHPGTVVSMDFGQGCPTTETRLDAHRSVTLMTDRSPDLPVTVSPAQVEGGTVCEARFFTRHADHGVCFTATNLFFRRMGPQVSLWTAKDYPDVTFDRYHYKNVSEWCTDRQQVTLTVRVPEFVQDQNAEFRFSFTVKNKTKSDIVKTYSMDSYRQCGVGVALGRGGALVVRGQRYPALPHMPRACQLTIRSSASEQYEQLCVTVTYIVDQNCKSQLTISGLNDDWWENETRSYGCHHPPPRGHVTSQEMCSKDKQLTLELTRAAADRTGMEFTLTVTSKWHPHWKAESSTQSQKQGFHFVQGLTYFIAAVDTMAGIIAAAVATMMRNPGGPWKSWMEGSQVPEHTQSYEVNYPTVSTSRMEEGSSSEVTGY